MAVIDHLRELRRRLIIVLLIIAAGAVVGWLIYNPVLAFLKDPYCHVPAKYRFAASKGQSCTLSYLEPLGGFTTRLKVSVITGTVFTAPLWLYQLWAFVTPGLRKNERKWTVVFVVLSSTLFALGMALAYAVLWKGLRVIIEAGGEGTQAFLTVNAYLSFVTLMLVVFGSAFELPLLVILMNLAHVLSYRILKKFQRVAIFLIFVFAGVATPTADPFTMCAMAIPMVLLFEAAVLFTFINDRRRARREALEPADALPDDVASDVDAIPRAVDDDPDAIP